MYLCIYSTDNSCKHANFILKLIVCGVIDERPESCLKKDVIRMYFFFVRMKGYIFGFMEIRFLLNDYQLHLSSFLVDTIYVVL